MQLGDIFARQCPVRTTLKFKTQFFQRQVHIADTRIFGAETGKLLSIGPFINPVLTQRLQPLAHINTHGRVGVRAGGIVYPHRRIGFGFTVSQLCIGQRNFAQRDL